MNDDKDDIARAQAARRGSPFLNSEQAAAYLGFSARKMRRLRASCSGPRYRLHGRFIRYHIDDLIFWSRSTGPRAGAGAHADVAAAGERSDA
jgi:hypothetical protein